MLTRYIFQCPEDACEIQQIEVIGPDNHEKDYIRFARCPLCGQHPLTYDQSMPASSASVIIETRSLPRLKMDMTFLDYSR